MDLGKCDVCETHKAVRVASLAGIPMSVAQCWSCSELGAVPYGIAVANTWVVGSLDAAAEWWKDTVKVSLEVAGKTMEEFLADVAAIPDPPSDSASRG